MKASPGWRAGVPLLLDAAWPAVSFCMLRRKLRRSASRAIARVASLANWLRRLSSCATRLSQPRGV